MSPLVRQASGGHTASMRIHAGYFSLHLFPLTRITLQSRLIFFAVAVSSFFPVGWH